MNLILIKNQRYIWICAIIVFLISIYFCFDQNVINHEKKISSVWCKRDLMGSRLCTFKNVYYDPKFSSFLFYLSDLSMIKGLSHYSEFQKIQLSSIEFHNKFEVNISIIKSDNYPIESVRIKKGVVFSRFKPDNIMHVIHDDLIPLFYTLQEICLGDMILCDKNYQLLFHDNYIKGPYIDLYNIFTNFEPILLPMTSKILYFEELHMGLIKESIFYQYGFDQVQGPIEDFKITGNVISQFADFITHKLNIKTDEYGDIVLISRKKNRKILNEKNLIKILIDVCKKIYSNLNCNVINLDLIENGTIAVIKAIKQASILVGMHGAEMIFSIFLKENSIVVELFPFGIQPEIVSFLNGLSKMNGIYFHYINWKNPFKNNSIFHPDADSHHGGINHLPDHIQVEIKRIEKVPAVNCCNDPTYLYYMYQDTWIDSSFEEFLTNELIKIKNVSTLFMIYDKWIFPSIVTNVLCQYNHSHLNMSWNKPFNMENEILIYDIFIYGQPNLKIHIMTGNTTLQVDVSNDGNDSQYQVWISVVIKRTNARSKDVYIECN